MNIIFLDIDGVLNCQLFFTERGKKKKELKNEVKSEEISREEYYKAQLCSERIIWLNELCNDVNAKVVISSTWRHSGLEHCKKVLSASGATFEIIDITPSLNNDCVRGNEILKWIKEHSDLVGPYYDFKTYAIIDDDSDMLYWQRNNFFQTDSYSGLTPNICYKIKKFFTNKTFEN